MRINVRTGKSFSTFSISNPKLIILVRRIFFTGSDIKPGQGAMMPPPIGNEEELASDDVVPEAAAAGPVGDFNLLFPDT